MPVLDSGSWLRFESPQFFAGFKSGTLDWHSIWALELSILAKKHSISESQLGKSFKMVLPAAAILLVGLFIIFSVFVYKISYPGPVPESVNPSHYLLPSLDLTIPSTSGDPIVAWWIPGLKGAPGIILAPGYGMCRSDALSLAVGLHNEGFNLLVYDQRG